MSTQTAEQATATEIIARKEKMSLVRKFANRYFIEPEKLMETLKKTAFKQSGDKQVTDEQMAALLVVADQYELNPFTKQIYAFDDGRGGIVPVVGVDGWANIINSHPELDGIEFETPPESEWEQIDADAKPAPKWMKCIIYRKDRNKPIAITEHLDEVYRPAFKRGDGSKVYGHHQTHTKRALRHKALIQCARVAFALTGIYDEDEAERIIDGEVVVEPGTAQSSSIEKLNKSVTHEPPTVGPEDQEQREVDNEERPIPEKPTRQSLIAAIKDCSNLEDLDIIQLQNLDHMEGEDQADVTTLVHRRRRELEEQKPTGPVF